MRGADALIHAAGSYRIGVKPSERAAMRDANVGTTERVLDAAVEVSVPRIVYISTVNAFGDTKGQVVDETYRRDLADGFLSWYDETKFRAHEIAEARIAGGAPIVIVQPSQVYGPHDHTAASAQLGEAFAGRLAYTAFGSCGLGWVHVEDLSRGSLTALERGRAGEAYVLSGPRHRLGDAVAIAAAPVVGVRPACPCRRRSCAPWPRSTTAWSICPGCPTTSPRRSGPRTASRTGRPPPRPSASWDSRPGR